MTGLYTLVAILSPERSAAEGHTFRVTLKNLPPDGNALKELALLLTHLPQGSLLVELFGEGNKENPPDYADAIICVSGEGTDWQAVFRTPLRHLRNKFSRPEIELEVAEGHSPLQPLTQEAHAQFLQLMTDLTCGVCKWKLVSEKTADGYKWIEQTPELTSNLAILNMKASTFEFTHIIRYTSDEFLRMIQEQAEQQYTRHGCQIAQEGAPQAQPLLVQAA
jgi:hypothetical protein